MTDIEIGLLTITNVSPKLNMGLKILLVVQGEITVETNSRYYPLAAKDLLIINRNQLYQVHGSRENCVLSISIADAFFQQLYPEFRSAHFACYSREASMEREPMVNLIRKLLAELMVSYYRKDEIYKIEIQEYICQILLVLIRRFKESGCSLGRNEDKDDRLNQIANYIEENYFDTITLEAIANQFYLSTGYLSRYFKQKLGIGVNRFIANVRLKHSIKDLLYTSASIAHIAMKNGFPNTKAFTHFFKEMHGETPTVFRKQHKKAEFDYIYNYHEQDAVTPINSPDILAKFGMLLLEDDQAYSNNDTSFESFELDFSNSTGKPIKKPKNLLLVGNLKNLLQADIKEQILLTKRKLSLEYIGAMDLLDESLIPRAVVTDEIIATTSPYFNLSKVIDFLIAEKLSLFIIVECDEIIVDEAKYFIKLSEFLAYCTQTYESTYTATWHFMFYEQWDTSRKPADLKRIYLKFYQLLKSYIAEASVGIFTHAAVSQSGREPQEAWLFAVAASIDFFGYSANQNESIDFAKLENDNVLAAKEHIKEKTRKIKTYLKKLGAEKPLHLVMWNTLSGNTRYTNGTFFRGALVLKSMLDIADDVASVGFWINTELHEQRQKHRQIPMEGLEIFHYFQGKRPVYFAMLFFARLKGNIIAKGIDYLVTQTPRGYQLILMNCNYVHPYYSIQDTFLRKLNKDIQVKLLGLPVGSYQIRKQIFDKDHGALYTNWRMLNRKYGMDQELIDYVIGITQPSIEIYDEQINGDLSFYSYLTTNAIHFFEIRKVLYE